MKVLLLADATGWIVERIVDRMIAGIPFEFTKGFYSYLTPEELVRLGNQHDLVHYGNWGSIDRFLGSLDQIKSPFLMSIRSFRFDSYVLEAAKKVSHVHVVNPGLLKFFPQASYIPDGIFEQFKPDHEFTVGYAGWADSYKGFHLIKQACAELGVKFKPVTGEHYCDEMASYYQSIDLYVCASEAEGFSTSVMECLAMNKPVITTDVGIPSLLNVHKVERSVEGIKNGIERFHTQSQVREFTWSNVCAQFEELYKKLCSS